MPGSLLLQHITITFHQPGKGSASPDANKTAPGGGMLGGEPSQLVALAGGEAIDAVARHFNHEGREGR